MKRSIEVSTSTEQLSLELEKVHSYCAAVSQLTNPKELATFSGALNFHGTGFWESHTSGLAAYLEEYEYSPTKSRQITVQNWRCYAICHSLRALAQGNVIFDDNIPPLVEAIVPYLDQIKGTDYETRPYGNRLLVVREINDVTRLLIPHNERDNQTATRAKAILNTAGLSGLRRLRATASLMIKM